MYLKHNSLQMPFWFCDYLECTMSWFFESKKEKRARLIREKAVDVGANTLSAALALALVEGVKAAYRAASGAIEARKAAAPVAAPAAPAAKVPAPAKAVVPAA